MRSRTRLLAALLVAAMCAPGTWLRSDIQMALTPKITVTQIEGAAQTSDPAWRVEGVWHFDAVPSLRFGGYSALLTLGKSTLRAFSDRGFRYTFPTPDQPDYVPSDPRTDHKVSRQTVGEARLNWVYWDIESATRDPATGNYWLGYENTHGIARFSIGSKPEGLRELDEEVDWYANSGLEAMERLSDGRFLAIAERKRFAMLYPADPVEGAEAQQIDFVPPAEGYAVTDLAQLPDGRVLLLMRSVVWGLPPFDGLLAIGDLPEVGEAQAWSPEVALRFEGVLPAENYEGLALREAEDGSVIVWIMSDDNLSAIQRTLLAKLVFEPNS